MFLPSALAFLILLAATPALAQGPQGSPSPLAARATQEPSPVPAPGGRRDAFVYESAGGDFRVQLGLLAHADDRVMWNDGGGQPVDTFLFRRVRPSLRGRVAHRFEFFLNPDFSTSSAVVVQDLYVDTAVAPAFHVRVGKQKTPFGLERLQSALNLLFLERAMPTAVAPNRDIGVQVLGDLRGGTFGYGAAVMNGVADGGSYESHATDGKDVSGRFVVRPFAKRADHSLHGLSLALSGSVGDQSQTSLRSFRTPTLQQRYFSYAGGVVNDGTRRRYSPQASYYHGRFGGFAEYVYSRAPLRRDAVRGDVGHEAWQAAGSWVLTGEAATDAIDGVRPRASFNPAARHWGAVQLAARYQALTVANDAFTLGFAAAGSSRKAAGWTAGVNWYLNGNVRWTSNVERIVFDAAGPNGRPAENLVALRVQLIF